MLALIGHLASLLNFLLLIKHIDAFRHSPRLVIGSWLCSATLAVVSMAPSIITFSMKGGRVEGEREEKVDEWKGRVDGGRKGRVLK